jgi:hypothetical protein
MRVTLSEHGDACFNCELLRPPRVSGVIDAAPSPVARTIKRAMAGRSGIAASMDGRITGGRRSFFLHRQGLKHDRRHTELSSLFP